MLADDFFRIAHDDTSGKPRLHAVALSVGLAAALLGELVSARRIDVLDGCVVVVDRTPPADFVSHEVLDTLLMEPQRHTLKTWLEFLSQRAHEQVAGRLLRAGHLRAETSRKLLRESATTYVPTDINVAAMPGALLSSRLRRHQPLEYNDACLAGLVLATGLDRFVLDGAPSSAFDYLGHLVARLTPPMPGLLHHTQVVISTAVLSHRG